MNKMILWFHSFPDEQEGLIDKALFEQISVSVFVEAQADKALQNLFSGSFLEFIDFAQKQDHIDDVEVILPAKEVIYTQVSVPSKSYKKITQALPFLLDDNLLKPVNKQHFALGKIVADQCYIGIVSRSIIEQLYNEFKNLMLPVSVMASEIFQLPYQPEQWSLTLYDQNLLIRMDDQSGISLPIKQYEFLLGSLLKIARSEEDESESEEDKSEIIRPGKIIIYSDDEHQQTAETIKNYLASRSLNSEIVSGNMTQFVLQENNNATKKNLGINLLQGEFDGSELNRSKIPFLKPLIMVMVIWLVSQLLFMGYQSIALTEQLTVSKTQLEKLYFDTFPESKRLIDVRTQTKNKLKQLQEKSSVDGSFLNILAMVGQTLKKFSDVEITKMRYNQKVLQLDIVSSGFIYNRIRQALKKQYSMQVEEKTSSKIKGKVHSTINFRLNE